MPESSEPTEGPSEGAEGPNMGSLPHGVLAHIFDGLRPRDLASVSCVCKSWRHLVALEAAANLVWRSFYSARWQPSGARWPAPGEASALPPLPTSLPATRPSAPMPFSSSSAAGSSSCGTSASASASSSLSCSPASDSPAAAAAASTPSSMAVTAVMGSSSTPTTASAPASSAGAPASAPTPTPTISNLTSPAMRWQWAYGSKMQRLKSWSGRYSADQVVGHKSAVRAVRLLPGHNLLATASLDRTVRLWDLAAGLPLASSRPHGGTVRCLALTSRLLASGCSDNIVRIWQPARASEEAGEQRPQQQVAQQEQEQQQWRSAAAASGRWGEERGEAEAVAVPLFDIASKPLMLRGHTGPVSCLALDEALRGGGSGGGAGETLYSGSWDCTVRIWRRSDEGGSGGSDDSDDGGDGGSGSDADGIFGRGSSGDESGISIARRGGGGGGGGGGGDPGAAGGGDDPGSGGWSCCGVLGYSDWVYAVAVRGRNLLVAAGSEVVVTDAATGRVVRRFAGLHDGGTVACLEGCRSGRLLFTASGDGLLLAHDLRMKHGSRVLWHHNAAVTGLSFEDPWLASASADGTIILQDSEAALAGPACPRALSTSCRALHCPPGRPALCLDLADQWLAAGTDSGVVRLWDFTGAEAAAERAAAGKAARNASRSGGRATGRHHNQQQQPQGQTQTQVGHARREPQQGQQQAQVGAAMAAAAVGKSWVGARSAAAGDFSTGAAAGAYAGSGVAGGGGSSMALPIPVLRHRVPGMGSGGLEASRTGTAGESGLTAAAEADVEAGAEAEGSGWEQDGGGKAGGGGGSTNRRVGRGARWRQGGKGRQQHPQQHSTSHAHGPHHHHQVRAGPLSAAPQPPAFRYVGTGVGVAGGAAAGGGMGGGGSRHPQQALPGGGSFGGGGGSSGGRGRGSGGGGRRGRPL